jgi:hypothetical protein
MTDPRLTSRDNAPLGAISKQPCAILGRLDKGEAPSTQVSVELLDKHRRKKKRQTGLNYETDEKYPHDRKTNPVKHKYEESERRGKEKRWPLERYRESSDPSGTFCQREARPSKSVVDKAHSILWNWARFGVLALLAAASRNHLGIAFIAEVHSEIRIYRIKPLASAALFVTCRDASKK